MAEVDHLDPPHTLPENSVLTLEEYLDMQRAVGNETRYRILVELLDAGESSATDLADTLEEPSNRLHYHLDKLVDVGLVQNRKRRERGTDGLYSYYVPTAMGEAIMNHGVAELLRREWELLEEYGE